MGFAKIRYLPGITARLLTWCLVLIAMFYAITMYLISQIQDVVSTSDQIVTGDFGMIVNAEKMIDTLLLFMENRRKYEILGREEYLTASREHLSKLVLQFETLHESDPLSDRMTRIQWGLQNIFSESPGQKAVDEGVVADLIEDLSQDRAYRLERINHSMREMHARGFQAQKWGETGLVIAIVFGMSMSLAIAFFMNRSMRELRKGISRIARDEEFEPVRIMSTDELGELAKAFNEMGARLQHEEQMRSEFISMLSHEIRTPLTSIREALSLILEEVAGPVGERQAPLLGIAQKETIRLSMLLSRLMQASTLQSRDIELNPGILSAHALVTEAVERIRPLALARRVDIRIETKSDDESILADQEHIQQVLFNLLGNALKFSPKDSTIHVFIVPIFQKGLVRICVADQGAGIPEHEQQYVFQRYYRGNSTGRALDGAGLGLSISRRIIEEHRGRLWLETSTSDGSIFCFTLPLINQSTEGNAV